MKPGYNRSVLRTNSSNRPILSTISPSRPILRTHSLNRLNYVLTHLIGLCYVPSPNRPILRTDSTISYVSYARWGNPNVVTFSLTHGLQLSALHWLLRLLIAYINLLSHRKAWSQVSPAYHTLGFFISCERSSYEWNKFPSICHCVPLSLSNLQIRLWENSKVSWCLFRKNRKSWLCLFKLLSFHEKQILIRVCIVNSRFNKETEFNDVHMTFSV
jgi:hypothetical protein